MRLSLVLLAVAVSGCWTTVPAVVTPEPPVAIRVEPPAPAPQPVLVERQPVEAAPTAPPPVPKRRIAQRSVFEAERVTEWTLDNGLTVVYAWDDDAPGYTALVTSPSGASGDGAVGERPGVSSTATRLLVSANRLDDAIGQTVDALADLGVEQATVLIHGPLDSEWIEPTVAADLGRLPSATSARRPSPAPGGAFVNVGWDDLPALHVVAALLARRSERGDGPTVWFDAARGRAMLRGGEAVSPATPGEIREARSLAVRQSAQPAEILATLDALYHLPGSFRPARPVSDARALADRIERTPPERVAALLARLARPDSP